MSVRALIFCGSGCTPFPDITYPRKGIEVHLKWHFSLFNFELTSSHLCSILCTAVSWSAPFLSYPITKMSSAMPNTLGMSLNISLILGWNLSTTGAAPNGSCLYQYQPNGHANVVRYDDFSSNFILWYPELASITDIYVTLLNLGSMSFNVGTPMNRSD